MADSKTFNPLDNNSTTLKNGFNPVKGGGMNVNAVQSLVSCDQVVGTQAMMEGIASEVNNLYGLDLYYYRQDFNPKKAHPLYGDQTTPFLGPYLIKGYITINSDSSLLTQFGIENTNDVDVQISYEEWRATFGSVSPQAGDKFEIKDLLCNRPSGFVRAIFEVTSQGDSDLFEASKRWFISGQRSDFTWLPNEPEEAGGDMVHSDKISGELDTFLQLGVEGNSKENALDRGVDDIAISDLKNPNDDVYGGFYIDENDL